MAISMLKIRRPLGCLIFNMGSPYLVRPSFLLRRPPASGISLTFSVYCTCYPYVAVLPHVHWWRYCCGYRRGGKLRLPVLAWYSQPGPAWKVHSVFSCLHVNPLRLKQNGCHFDDDVLNSIFLKENVCILIKKFKVFLECNNAKQAVSVSTLT